jgi:hypothetical protein
VFFLVLSFVRKRTTRNPTRFIFSEEKSQGTGLTAGIPVHVMLRSI